MKMITRGEEALCNSTHCLIWRERVTIILGDIASGVVRLEIDAVRTGAKSLYGVPGGSEINLGSLLSPISRLGIISRVTMRHGHTAVLDTRPSTCTHHTVINTDIH